MNTEELEMINLFLEDNPIPNEEDDGSSTNFLSGVSLSGESISVRVSARPKNPLY